MTSQPGILSDLRVLDLSGITAGGRTTQLLGDFGADVIKIEGPRRPDPFRHWSGVTGEAGGGDLGSPPFRVVGRNKRGVVIDLKDPRGTAVFRSLVAASDLVVENFRRGVMAKLGIGFETLREWNPRVVLLSISSQGEDGPERDYVSFGGTLEALSGLMSVTGYGPDQPVWTTSKVNFPDQVVALLAPGLALHAVMRSRRTGTGMHVDLSQRETVISLLGEQLVESSITGTTPRSRGNASGVGTTVCCQALGDDDWLVISIRNAAEWASLTDVIGRVELRADPRFHDEAARRANASELRREIETWTRTRDKLEAMSALQRSAVPAAAVLRAWELQAQEAARDESFHVAVPTGSGVSEQQISWPFTVETARLPTIGRRAPHVGEHTEEVLLAMGSDADDLDQLRGAGVITQLDHPAQQTIATVQALRSGR